MLRKIRRLVKGEAGERVWKFHIVPVVKYAKQLAKVKKADVKSVEIAALLHDIGRIRFGGKDHDKTGALESVKILSELGASRDLIEEVRHSTECHRMKDKMPGTLIAKIIANADAMSHLDIIPLFFFWRAERGNFDEAYKWVDEKLKRDWNTKLSMPEAKKIMKQKYKAIRVIMDSTKQHM